MRKRTRRLALALDELQREHLESMISNLAPSRVKKRWMYFARPEALDGWHAIDPWAFWSEQRKSVECSEVVESISSFVDDPMFLKLAGKDADVVTFHLSHAKPRVETYRIYDAFHPNNIPVEGIISIVKGKLILVINHNGMVMLVRRTRP